MHGDFSNKLTRKIHAEQCLALYSRLGLSAVQTSEPTSKTQGNTLLVLLLCNILYHVSHHDNCIVQKCIVAGLQYLMLNCTQDSVLKSFYKTLLRDL